MNAGQATFKRDGTTPDTFPDSAWKQRFRRALLRWFDRNARDLPWRRTRKLYHVWVSEIMLQQTQVATVVGYYERFIEQFPSINSLARAEQQAVLRCWEGLGYYRRAVQLHNAARKIVNEHGGRFPTRIDQVRALPGIGRYTAGAILSIALDQRHPILEANTLRVYSRLLAFQGDPMQGDSQRLLWRFAELLLPRRRVGDLNQALMELGSTLCTPRDPCCERCPVRALCPTRAEGLQEKIPRPKSKPKTTTVREAAVVIRHDGNVLLRYCRPGERWAGLWDFPRFAVAAPAGRKLEKEMTEKVAQSTGLTVTITHHLTTLKHSVTRYRITLTCHVATCTDPDIQAAELSWVPLDQLSSYPLSTTGRKVGNLLLLEQ